MRTLIIEDENKSRDSLLYLLDKYCPEVTVCGSSANFEDGYQLFREQQPALLFVDIHLNAPEGTGLDLVKLIDRSPCAVVFTSGFREYAVEAFRLKAIDYLLKPIRIEQLVEAVQKALAFTSKSAQMASARSAETFHIPTTSGFQLIRQHDIIRCEADGAYTHLFLTGSREYITTSTNIGQIAPRLGDDFMRVHKSHIVNKQFVTGYSKGDALFVRIANRWEIPVSRTHRDGFFAWLG